MFVFINQGTKEPKPQWNRPQQLLNQHDIGSTIHATNYGSREEVLFLYYSIPPKDINYVQIMLQIKYYFTNFFLFNRDDVRVII